VPLAAAAREILVVVTPGVVCPVCVPGFNERWKLVDLAALVVMQTAACVGEVATPYAYCPLWGMV